MSLHGADAPPFALPDLNEKTVTVKDFRGKVLMINFWADWCAPCLIEMPSLHRSWLTMRGAGVELLTVHVGGNQRSVRQFVQDKGYKFPVVVDEGAKTFKQWPSRGLPTTFILDPHGKMMLAAAGAREWDTRAMMDPILALLRTAT